MFLGELSQVTLIVTRRDFQSWLAPTTQVRNMSATSSDFTKRMEERQRMLETEMVEQGQRPVNSAERDVVSRVVCDE